MPAAVEKDKKEVHRLYMKGLTMDDISKKIGVRPATLRTFITRERQKNPDMWPSRKEHHGPQIQVDVFMCCECQTVFAILSAEDEVTCPYCLSEFEPQSLGTTFMTQTRTMSRAMEVGESA